MLNSHQRCSDSSILCINAKTCTFRYFDEFFQANQLQMIITGVPSWSFFPLPSPDFIRGSVVVSGRVTKTGTARSVIRAVRTV